jgi:ketosteroid isomerase-like protein
MSANPAFELRGAENDHAALLRAYYSALHSRDVEGALRLLSPDFVAHVPGSGVLAGEYWNHEGFIELVTKASAHGEGFLDLRVPVMSVNGDDAFTRELMTLNRRSEPDHYWALAVSMHYKMKAGKISEMWVLPEGQRLFDDFWRAEPNTNDRRSKADKHAPAYRAGALQVTTNRESSPESLRLLAEFYECFFRGDLDGVRKRMAGDVLVDIPGESALSGRYRGWDAFMRFRQRVTNMIDRRYKLEIDSMAASDNDGWVKEYIRMDRPWDRTVRTIYVVMHFEFADGMVTRMDDFPVDTYAWEEFFTPPPSRLKALAAGL